MKKAVIGMLLIVSLCIIACVPTPEEEIVVQKNMETMLDKAKPDDSDTEDIPLAERLGVYEGKYTYTTTAVEERLNISINADVHVPNVTQLPIIRVEKSRFTQEFALKVAEYFLKDGPVYDKTLPDEPIFDGQIRPYINGEYGDGSYYYMHIGNKTQLEINAGEPYKSVSAWISATDKASHENDLESISFHSYEEGKTINYFEREARDADISDKTFQKAKKCCDEFFQELEIADDYAFGFASEVSGSSFYLLYYTRIIDGVESYISNSAMSVDENSYAVPWGYETIIFVADKNGIEELHWDCPIHILNTVQERTVLLPFSTIVPRFESMVKVKYAVLTDDFGGQTGTMEIAASDIRLCLIRIREQHSDGTTGLLVPAWVFYGHNKIAFSDGTERYNLQHGSASSYPSSLYPVIIINAIDGSVIDLSEGY